jgi:hypothetical protein
VFYFMSRQEGESDGTLLGDGSRGDAPRLRVDLAPNAVQLRLDY